MLPISAAAAADTVDDDADDAGGAGDAGAEANPPEPKIEANLELFIVFSLKLLMLECLKVCE